MNAIKLVAVFAENKPGQTSHVTGILANAHINIRCATLASIGAFGVIKLLVTEPELACQALKHGGVAATLVDALAVEVPDKPGALHAIADCLAKKGINLENLSGFVVNNRAVLVLELQNVLLAADVLQKQGLHVLTREETLAL
jgi:hypothetical protein